MMSGQRVKGFKAGWVVMIGKWGKAHWMEREGAGMAVAICSPNINIPAGALFDAGTFDKCKRCLAKRGEKIKRLCQIRVISTRQEPLNAITQEDVIKEGFPDWTPAEFIQMIVDHYNKHPMEPINRIEFEYVEGGK